MNITATEFWGEQDTSGQFCEDKYDHVYWIAEYYNSLSSFYYIIIGLIFLNTRVSHLGKTLILVGIGAFLLHMTLRYYAQMLDESAMIILSFDAVRHVKPRVSRWLIFPILIFYVLFHNYFLYFFILFAAFQIYIAHIGLKMTKPKSYAKWFLIGYIILFSLGTICWLADQFLCQYVKSYQMHAWWHLLTSLAIGLGLLVFLDQ